MPNVQRLENPRGTPIVGWFATAALLLPLAYVASFGPAIWVADHWSLDFVKVCTAYGPLVRACESLPVSVRHAIRWYALAGSRSASTLEAVWGNALLFRRHYPVGDLAFVTQHGIQRFYPQPLIDELTCEIAPESWDDVGGPGSIIVREVSQELVVLQSSEVHESIAARLLALREFKSSLTEGGELDLPALYRVWRRHRGDFRIEDLHPKAIRVRVTDQEFLQVDEGPPVELQEGMSSLSKMSDHHLRFGVVMSRSRLYANSIEDTALQHLRDFCEERDVDLFAISPPGNVFGAVLQRFEWIVQSNSSRLCRSPVVLHSAD